VTPKAKKAAYQASPLRRQRRGIRQRICINARGDSKARATDNSCGKEHRSLRAARAAGISRQRAAASPPAK